MTNDTKFTVVKPDFGSKNKNVEEAAELRKSILKALTFIKKESEKEEAPARCLVAFTFDEDSTPNLVLAGKIDPLECLGFLKVVEMDLLQRMYEDNVIEDLEPEDFEGEEEGPKDE